VKAWEESVIDPKDIFTVWSPKEEQAGTKKLTKMFVLETMMALVPQIVMVICEGSHGKPCPFRDTVYPPLFPPPLGVTEVTVNATGFTVTPDWISTIPIEGIVTRGASGPAIILGVVSEFVRRAHVSALSEVAVLTVQGRPLTETAIVLGETKAELVGLEMARVRVEPEMLKELISANV
jgi:hypothetical protein